MLAAFTWNNKDRMTMRREVLMISAACLALLAPATALTAQTGSPCVNGNKVALVNAQRILASIPAFVQAESLLAKEVDGYQADLAKQQASFDSARAAYSENATMLNAGAKSAAMKKLQDQNDALQKHATDLRAKADQRSAELVDPIRTRVQEVLDGMRAELNCSIVFDVSANAGIASADKSLDLTDRVIDRLRAAAGPTPTPGKPPAGGGIKPPAGGGGGGGDLPADALPAEP